MIFLIPLIIIIAIIFGVDHYYFSDENAKIERKVGPNHEQKVKRAKEYLHGVLLDESNQKTP